MVRMSKLSKSKQDCYSLLIYNRNLKKEKKSGGNVNNRMQLFANFIKVYSK